jgi:hypothetical protein
MSTQGLGLSNADLQSLAALQVLQATQSGTAAVQAAVGQEAGGGAAPIVSSAVTAPGALELFA